MKLHEPCDLKDSRVLIELNRREAKAIAEFCQGMMANVSKPKLIRVRKGSLAYKLLKCLAEQLPY